jgi:hypothetical protein
MKTNDITSRIAFFTLIGALFAYYYQIHLCYLEKGYDPGEAQLSDNMGYILPATLFEVAFVALLWAGMFTKLEIDGFARIFFTAVGIVVGFLPSVLFTTVIDELGKVLHLYNERDPFLFYSILGAAYLVTGIVAILKKHTLLEGTVYFLILLHSCGLILYRLVLKIPMGGGAWGVGPT